MQNSTSDQLRKALNADLKKMASLGLGVVVNDATRRVFTAKATGSVFEFGHSQPDQAFWCGVKYYGSGPSSRVRIRRTPVAIVKPSRKRAAASIIAAEPALP
jgi:hypothetical protein